MKAPRLQVPMTIETKRMLDEYADATSSTLPKVCEAVLAEAAPTLEELAHTLRQAKSAPSKALRDANRLMERKIAEAEQHKLDLSPKDTDRKTG